MEPNPGGGHELEAEGARIFERIGPVCVFQNQPENTLFATLAAVNLAEIALPRRDRVRAYVDLTMGCSLLPVPGLARTYERLTRIALSEHPRLTDEGWARTILGMIDSAQASWDVASAELQKGCEIQQRLGDHRRHWEASMLLAAVKWLTGDCAGGLSISRSVLEAAQRAGDIHMQSGSNAHVAYGLLRGGELALAVRHLEAGARCADEASAVPEQVYNRGLLAMTRALEGRSAEGCAELDRVLALLPKLLPTAFYVIEGYGAVVEAALRLSSADARGPARLRQALKELTRYARTFPIAAPRLLRYQGQLARSLVRARELRLPVDEALALLPPSAGEAIGVEARAAWARVGTPFEQRQVERGERPLLG